MFDVPPPENDDEAFKLGKKIRQWIKDGKPELGEDTDEDDKEEYGDDEDEEEIHKHDKEEPKKKKGRLGFFRR